MKAKISYAVFNIAVLPVLFAFLLVFPGTKIFGQAEAPYSRFGLGELCTPAFSANGGMGDLAAPYASAVNINFSNPASYASLTRSTLEIGALLDGSNIRDKDSSYTSTNGSVNHLVLAIVPPAKNVNWAVCVGLLPYSYVNYNFAQNYNDSVLGPYSQIYNGSGSLYQGFIGGAIKVKGFAIGVNLCYIFGQLQYEKVVSFTDSLGDYFNTRNVTDVNIKGFSYTVGIQYQHLIYTNRNDHDIRRDVYVFAGAYGSGGSNLTATISNYWDRYNFDINNNLAVIDTLQSTFNQKGKMNIPYNFGAGIMFGNERFWMIGADFKYNNWSNFTTPLDNGGLTNSWQASLGGQITPNYEDRNYLNRVQYRFGAYYGKSEIIVQGYNLSQGGATLGLGLPLYKNWAHINLTGNFGSIAAPNNTVIRETYYRFTFGLVLNDDNWFAKRKYF